MYDDNFELTIAFEVAKDQNTRRCRPLADYTKLLQRHHSGGSRLYYVDIIVKGRQAKAISLQVHSMANVSS